MSNPAENMTWVASNATFQGKVYPCSTANSPDMRTMIEILGPPDRIKQVAVAGQIIDKATADQVATYMVMAMRLILPQWTGANAWLSSSLRIVEKRGPQTITMQGWKIRMGWIVKANTVTLQATH